MEHKELQSFDDLSKIEGSPLSTALLNGLIDFRCEGLVKAWKLEVLSEIDGEAIDASINLLPFSLQQDALSSSICFRNNTNFTGRFNFP